MGERQSKSAKKILVVTPRFPVPPPGACEKDRYYSLLQLRDLGFEVHVLAKVLPNFNPEVAHKFEIEQGIGVTTLPYRFMLEKSWKFYLAHLLPWNWDGAAYEYAHKDTKDTFQRLLDEFKPDLVWFDYTYLWPLYKFAKRRQIPIVTRSINFEAKHFLEEDGYSLINIIRFIPKFVSELVTLVKSNWLFAITPDEQKIYERIGGKGKTSTLPLRGLAKVIDKPVPVHEREALHVFFMGSTYNVHHNSAALEYIIRDIAPIIEGRKPGKFIFHILGKQIPQNFEKYVRDNVRYVGYQDPKTYLQDMDIALVPSLFGAGMQQKVFEPMALGLPLVTHRRAIAGYDFTEGEHYLAADSTQEFIDSLERLEDPKLRERLSQAAYERSKELFSQAKLDNLVNTCVQKFI